MNCALCGSDGEVFDTDFFDNEVILEFYCFNPICEYSAEADSHVTITFSNPVWENK